MTYIVLSRFVTVRAGAVCFTTTNHTLSNRGINAVNLREVVEWSLQSAETEPERGVTSGAVTSCLPKISLLPIQYPADCRATALKICVDAQV